MKLPTKLLNEEEFVMTAGIVGTAKDGKTHVRTAKGLILAVRAAGCLLEPQEGDTVLLVENSYGGGYILTVLERDEKKTAVVDIPGTVAIKAGGGLTIAGEDVNLTGREQVYIATPVFNLRSRESSVETINLNIKGKHLLADLKSAKTVLGSLESSVGRLVERITRYYARIDELADMRYKRLRCFVSETLFMKGRDVNVRAEGHINMDGKKINMG
jgi:hypothetical protein